MAPKSPWTKKATVTTNVPKQSAAAPVSTTAINYGEAQSEEVEALQAIYMEDFAEVEVKGAWSTTTDRSFSLQIRAISDKESCVTLLVRLTATYPKTAPLLEVRGVEGYHERTQKRIRNIVEKRPKQLLGEVMISTIADEIQDALEDAVQARQQGTLPSLEDERASAEEVTAALAKQTKENEAQRLHEEKEEEDRVLQQMVDEEINRREKRKPTKSADEQTVKPGGFDGITFDKPATIQVNNESATFTKVSIVSVLSQRRDLDSYLATPHLSGTEHSAIVAIKRFKFEKSREEVMDLETVLESAQKLVHVNIARVFAYHIDKIDDMKYEMVLCTENTDRGTLYSLLELGGLHVDKARQFAIQLLEGLHYLHRNVVAQGTLSTKTIGVVSSPAVSVKLTDFGYSSSLGKIDELPVKWRPTEWESKLPSLQQKSDIWYLGVVMAQMFLGLQVITQHSAPHVMLGRLDLSDSFDDFLRKMFTVDAKKRPTAFDLLPAEFLRTDDPVMEGALLAAPSTTRDGHRQSAAMYASPGKRRSRHNSSNAFEPMSRYATDFTEVGRLGKGGFGEVVKARNKLDGGIYAVKKIKQAPELLDQVISEVMVLNRLNHPYVVRYFGAWIEEEVSGTALDGSTTETETATETINEESESDGQRMDFGYPSTSGLDFLSSAGVEFGEDSDSDAENENEDSDDEQAVQNGNRVVESSEPSKNGNLRLRKSRSDSRRPPSMLYIQMEYCERHTLRDLIRKTMTADDSWRYVRQITEGLAHIHGLGIIHRDLKPDNVFLDIAGNPKIGDFGLATTSQYQFSEKAVTMSGYSAGDMTRSVGTTLYVAPELRSAAHTTYNDKVDMYSLGIIFYEMCQPFSTGMERIRALQEVRETDHELPAAYQPNGEKAAQGKLISCLISHKPSERPSSTELIRSDLLPLKIEDETIRQALSGLGDPRSPYHQKMMSALFSHDSASNKRVKALAWDASSAGVGEDPKRLRLRGIAKKTLGEVFRRHGAEEGRRPTIFPRSGYYTDPRVVQLLDASGNLLQLPWDLTLPHARQIARNPSKVRCTFAFGNAYRDLFDGGPPSVSEEVDFDITDNGGAEEQALNDAEVLKVMDEVACEMPLFAMSVTMSFHVNHSEILNAILNHSRVPLAQQGAVKEVISRLGFHQHTWNKVRVELRKAGLPDTTLDDIQQFDFREVPDKAFARLRTLFEGSRYHNKLENGIRSLQDVLQIVTPFNLQRKLYISPLGSVNAKFYDDGILFQCVLERKSNRVVIAAGGRYDSLIRTYKQADARSKPQGAVGVSIGLDPIISNMVKNSENSSKKSYLKKQTREESTTKRCDVLVAAAGTDTVKLAGIKLLTSFWANDISAELSTDRAPRGEEHTLIVSVRHEASNSVKVTSSGKDSEETEVSISSLVGYVQQELREHESNRARAPALLRQASQPDVDRRGNVQVLLARHGSKKSNKYQIVSDAQEQWSRKLDDAKSAPILAVETRDDVIDMIQQTRLSDAESWRRAVQSAQPSDRQYVQQIQEKLDSWRKEWTEGEGMREACVFNFRTQHCIYYDLGL